MEDHGNPLGIQGFNDNEFMEGILDEHRYINV